MSGTKFSCHLLAALQVLALLFAFIPGSFAQRKPRMILTPETVFSNPSSITINTSTGLTQPTLAATYPSQINVSGMAGNTTRVAVTFNGITHPNLSHLDFLLVSPGGAKFIFASDLQVSTIVDSVYTFADDAATLFPSGTAPLAAYKPTSGDGVADVFPAPAPAGPYNIPNSSTFASSFNGASPNGTWSLYVVDDVLGIAGSLNDGWALNITTDSTAATSFANPNYIAINDIVTPASPYGSVINVSGQTGKISNLKVTLTGITHNAPGNIDILLVSPNGKSSILMSDAGGTVPASGVNVTFDDTAASAINANLISGTFRPTDQAADSDDFVAPAPYRPYHAGSNNALSNFNGYSPNGDWKLFVVDDTQNNSGVISGGWSLDVTTTPIVPPTPPSCSSATFARADLPVGTGPTNIAIADFNNDSKDDLAVTNQISNDVSILIGNGSGGFTPVSSILAGNGPYAIAAGKFNADGNFDLAIVNSNSNNVSILLGNGNGTFSLPTNFFVGPSPISVAVGDFNNDTKQDLAVANFGGFFTGSVSILLGNGSGGFTAGNNVRTGSQPAFVAAADFNGDTKPDLAVANSGSATISIFFGDGTGGFLLNQTLSSNGNTPVAIEIADFTGSGGFLDLAVADYNSNLVVACPGNAGGVFSTCNAIIAGIGNPVSITSGDFILTGSATLAVASSSSNFIRIGNDLPVGLNPNAVRKGNFNADSKPDLVSANSGSNNISVLLNVCQVATGNLFDFNGDKRTDVGVFRPTDQPTWWTYPTPFPRVFGRGADVIVPADYDGDRATDYGIYRPSTGLWYITGNSGSGSNPLYFLQFGIPGDIAMPADYDGDGKADIAVWRPSDGNWFIRRSSDNVVTGATFGMNGDQPVAADYDGDGKDDIAVYRPSTGNWYIFRSSDSQVQIGQFGLSGDKTVAGDYDGDSKADLAVWRPSTGVWYVLRSTDGGASIVNWGLFGDLPAVGDFDGDGRFDYTVWRPSDITWYTLRSSDNLANYTQWGITTDVPIPGAYVR